MDLLMKKPKKSEIFIVDDNEIFGKLVLEGFRDNPFRANLRYFSHVESALAQIMISSPKLLFIDQFLGHTKGTEIIPLIQKYTTNCRIILISSGINFGKEISGEESIEFIKKDNNFLYFMKKYIADSNLNV